MVDSESLNVLIEAAIAKNEINNLAGSLNELLS